MLIMYFAESGGRKVGENKALSSKANGSSRWVTISNTPEMDSQLIQMLFTFYSWQILYYSEPKCWNGLCCDAVVLHIGFTYWLWRNTNQIWFYHFDQIAHEVYIKVQLKSKDLSSFHPDVFFICFCLDLLLNCNSHQSLLQQRCENISVSWECFVLLGLLRTKGLQNAGFARALSIKQDLTIARAVLTRKVCKDLLHQCLRCEGR